LLRLLLLFLKKHPSLTPLCSNIATCGSPPQSTRCRQAPKHQKENNTQCNLIRRHAMRPSTCSSNTCRHSIRYHGAFVGVYPVCAQTTEHHFLFNKHHTPIQSAQNQIIEISPFYFF
jgi:hypothetical protein